MNSIAVHFVLLPHSLILDWAGPAEALRIANQALVARGLPARFRLQFVGPKPQLPSSVGATIANLAALPDLTPTTPGHHWVVLVGQPGRTIELDQPPAQPVLHWLRGLQLHSGRLELMCVCAGSVIAARAGLLDGRSVTTHHQHLDELHAAAPGAHVVSNRVFVVDGPVCSSAGVTTGIDLVLHRISAVCGPVVAAEVAQTLVVALRRGPQDPELSPFLAHRNHLHPALHRVQDAISQAPHDPWTLDTMAHVACTSPRHLTRLFTLHAGVAPLHYLQGIRLAIAQTALRAGHSVTQAAALAGFNSDTQLRRAWHRLGVDGTPTRLRASGS